MDGWALFAEDLIRGEGLRFGRIGIGGEETRSGIIERD